MTGNVSLAIGYAYSSLPHSDLSIVCRVGLAPTLIGIGMGMANLTTLVAAQNSVPRATHRRGDFDDHVVPHLRRRFRRERHGHGDAQSNATWFEPIARGNYRRHCSDKLANPQNLLEPQPAHRFPPNCCRALIASLGDAIWYAFLTGFVLMILGARSELLHADYTPRDTATPRSAE